MGAELGVWSAAPGWVRAAETGVSREDIRELLACRVGERRSSAVSGRGLDCHVRPPAFTLMASSNR